LYAADIHEHDGLSGWIGKKPKDPEVAFCCRYSITLFQTEFDGKASLEEDSLVFQQKIDILSRAMPVRFIKRDIAQFGSDAAIEKRINPENPDRLAMIESYLSIDNR
jgi:hypothetical protein